MSIEYTLELEDKMEPKALLSRVAEITGLPLVHENVLRDEKSHHVISVYNVDDEYCADETEKDFGFRPEVSIFFAHGKVEHERNSLLMISVVTELLKEVNGDAVLIYTEDPGAVLQKIDNVITVDPEWKDIPGMDMLKKKGLTYKLEKIHMDL